MMNIYIWNGEEIYAMETVVAKQQTALDASRDNTFHNRLCSSSCNKLCNILYLASQTQCLDEKFTILNIFFMCRACSEGRAFMSHITQNRHK